MSAPARYSTVGPDPVVAAATGTVAAGVLLTTLPLRSVFTDWSWLLVSIGCVLPYLAVVGLARMRSTPRWWHSAAGLLASVLMLLWVFVPQHLWLGVLPTPSSFGDIGDLVRSANTSMQREHAPLASTGALRLLVASALVALVALTDVLAVLLRRPLLASAPLLEVLAIASATSSKAAHPVWFATAAGGFLLIMLSGTRLQDRAWGPSVDGTAGRLGGARRMAVTGVLAALVIPLLLPSVSVNVLARATHHNGGDGDGPGKGTGRQIVLNNMASLSGTLRLAKPVQLFQVKVNAGIPFYVRQEVDDEFADNGWRPSGRYGVQDNPVPLNQGPFNVGPFEDPPARTPSRDFEARFTLLALGGSTLPILAQPTSIRSPGDGVWNSATASVTNASLRRGMSYTETASEPAPTLDELRAAPAWQAADEDTRARLVGLPPNMPQSAQNLTDQVVAGLTSPYEKAKAISDFFTNGKNGFQYSLTTSDRGDRSALEAFLDPATGRKGFCQQYAAAAGVMMRMAGLPTRVVIGYTHRAPDSNGLFTVLTSDAHAWVEVYFSGIGWIPFDPTPLVGAEAGRAVNLPWAAHPGAAAAETAEPTANRGPSASASATAAPAAQASNGGDSFGVPTVVIEIGLLVVLALVLILGLTFGPQWLRRRQRRRRLERARTTGNPEPLWLELAATATDRDALWPSTITVGQVAGWLSRHGVDERGRAAVTAVADRVERDRFSAQLVQELPADSIAALDQALTRWARRTDRRLSLLHRWLPRSLISGQPRWRR